jgi:hypothetical protein
MKQGVVLGLKRIATLNIAEFRYVYDLLAARYGTDDDFDFNAFRIRHEYVNQIIFNGPAAWVCPNYDAFVQSAKQKFLNDNIPDDIIMAIRTADLNSWLTAQEVSYMLSVLGALAPDDRTSLLPIADAQLMKNDDKFNVKINAIRVALLKKFVRMVSENIESGPTAIHDAYRKINRQSRKLEQLQYTNPKGLVNPSIVKRKFEALSKILNLDIT